MSDKFESSIYCFNHCSKTIFYKQCLKICPICKRQLDKLENVPFQIPFPFINATESSTSIVIRPSRGNFLENYNVNDDLHCAITDSQNRIFEFDKIGIVQNDFKMWKSCIAINIVSESWYDHWDKILQEIISQKMWSNENYQEKSLNCFSFVIAFLNKLNYNNLNFSNKEDICQKFILPRIHEVLRYVTVYRNLKSCSFYIQN